MRYACKTETSIRGQATQTEEKTLLYKATAPNFVVETHEQQSKNAEIFVRGVNRRDGFLLRKSDGAENFFLTRLREPDLDWTHNVQHTAAFPVIPFSEPTTLVPLRKYLNFPTITLIGKRILANGNVRLDYTYKGAKRSIPCWLIFDAKRASALVEAGCGVAPMGRTIKVSYKDEDGPGGIPIIAAADDIVHDEHGSRSTHWELLELIPGAVDESEFALETYGVKRAAPIARSYRLLNLNILVAVLVALFIVFRIASSRYSKKNAEKSGDASNPVT
jgi:hypothetical protein